jgi:uncharacterized protein (TIGR02646 family)
MPDGWIGRSKAAALAVSNGANPNTFGDVWRELKAGMMLLSDNKCWYCESPVDRDDNAVDHFRPKNRVFEALQPHLGYRWLAFEKDNFRFACTFCNSKRIDVEFGTAGGKADRFPLLDENTRVYTIGTIEFENPELLDPCEIEDCDLLGCQQENGKPCPTSENPTERRRVNTSIEVFHLDRDATCKRRHTVLVGLISDILDAQRLFELSRIDVTRKPEFIKVAKRIQSNISTDAPYSGEMKYLFRGQRSEKHPWMQKLLEA